MTKPLPPFDRTPVKLTDTQKRILRLIEEGHATEDIAEELFLSPWTVRDKLRVLAGILHCRLPDMPARARERGAEF